MGTPHDSVDWEGSWTLEDYVISLFKTKKTDSLEFKLLLRIYGREKLEEIWRKYVQNRKGQQ